MKNVKIKGLMAMASNTNENQLLSEFVHAKKIFDEINNGEQKFRNFINGYE